MEENKIETINEVDAYLANADQLASLPKKALQMFDLCKKNHKHLMEAQTIAYFKKIKEGIAEDYDAAKENVKNVETQMNTINNFLKDLELKGFVDKDGNEVEGPFDGKKVKYKNLNPESKLAKKLVELILEGDMTEAPAVTYKPEVLKYDKKIKFQSKKVSETKVKEIVKVENLHSHYVTRTGTVKAVSGINFKLGVGEKMGLVGETGAGKSTTALSILGLLPRAVGKIIHDDKDVNKEEQKIKEQEEDHSGEIQLDVKTKKKNKSHIYFKGKRIDNLPEQERRLYRGSEISMIFQDPMTSLNPVQKVVDQIAEVVANHAINDKDQIVKIIKEAPERLEILERQLFLQMEKLSKLKSQMLQAKATEKFASKKSSYKKLSDLRDHNKKRYLKLVKAIQGINAKGETVNRDSSTKGRVVKKMIADYSEETALQTLEYVGISRDRAYAYPHQFSGGMKQRVVIAIALANKPALLIADEPTTALDVTIQAQIIKLIKELEVKYKTSTIFITHDLGVVAQTCDTVGIMYGGKIVEKGKVADVFKNRKHPYTKGLFNSIPTLSTSSVNVLEAIPGTQHNRYHPPLGCPYSNRCKEAMPICKVQHPEPSKTGTHEVECWLYSPKPMVKKLNDTINAELKVIEEKDYTEMVNDIEFKDDKKDDAKPATKKSTKETK